MPITIPLPDGPAISPGFQTQLNTDLVGPFEIGTFWEVQWFVGPSFEDLYAVQTMPLQTNVIGFVAFSNTTLASQPSTPARQLQEGDQIRASVVVKDPRQNVLDSGQRDFTWDTSGLWSSIAQTIPEGTTGGGLTEEQAAQLEATTEASALSSLTDALTLTELTSGPSGGPLVALLATTTFGILVRLSTIPDGLTPQTPDGQYWTKTLAVVRIFRGNDLWIRAPIHTPTKIVSLEHEGLTVWVPALTLTEWLLNMRVLVDFLPGVTGQVFQMHFP